MQIITPASTHSKQLREPLIDGYKVVCDVINASDFKLILRLSGSQQF